IKNNFPVVTTKKMPIKTIIAEMLCFLRGYDEVDQFKSMGVNVWNANAESSYWKANPNHKEGWLGRIYGVQWRDWRGGGSFFEDISTDQITDLIARLKSNPHDRRHIVTAWNPAELDLMCLPPCHMFFQVNVNSKKELNLLLYQRSCDMFLGVPFN